MALDRNTLRIDRQTAPDFYGNDAGRSSFASFLIGGVVVAGGLLTFLFYDGGTFNDRDRDFMATGSVISSQPPITSGLPANVAPDTRK